MSDGASVIDNTNEFNSLLSRLVPVDIKCDDTVQTMLFLSSLADSWSETITAVASRYGTTKLIFEGIKDLILSEDVHRKNVKESTSSYQALKVQAKGL